MEGSLLMSDLSMRLLQHYAQRSPPGGIQIKHTPVLLDLFNLFLHLWAPGILRADYFPLFRCLESEMQE